MIIVKFYIVAPGVQKKTFGANCDNRPMKIADMRRFPQENPSGSLALDQRSSQISALHLLYTTNGLYFLCSILIQCTPFEKTVQFHFTIAGNSNRERLISFQIFAFLCFTRPDSQEPEGLGPREVSGIWVKGAALQAVQKAKCKHSGIRWCTMISSFCV